MWNLISFFENFLNPSIFYLQKQKQVPDFNSWLAKLLVWFELVVVVIIEKSKKKALEIRPMRSSTICERRFWSRKKKIERMFKKNQ